MHYASWLGRDEIVRILAPRVADFDDADDVRSFSHFSSLANGEFRFLQSGRTALHLASLQGHVAVVRCLIEVDVDISARDRVRYSSLLDAYTLQMKICVQERSTPLHLACDGGHLHVVQVLLEYDALTHVKDKKGRTPLHIAKSHDNSDMVTLLNHSRARASHSAKVGILDTETEDGLIHLCLVVVEDERRTHHGLHNASGPKVESRQCPNERES